MLMKDSEANGVEPQAWMIHVLVRIAEGWPIARLDELMPWNWRSTKEAAKLAA